MVKRFVPAERGVTDDPGESKSDLEQPESPRSYRRGQMPCGSEAGHTTLL